MKTVIPHKSRLGRPTSIQLSHHFKARSKAFLRPKMAGRKEKLVLVITNFDFCVNRHQDKSIFGKRFEIEISTPVATMQSSLSRQRNCQFTNKQLCSSDLHFCRRNEPDERNRLILISFPGTAALMRYIRMIEMHSRKICLGTAIQEFRRIIRRYAPTQ